VWHSQSNTRHSFAVLEDTHSIGSRHIHCLIHVLCLYPSRWLSHLHWWIKSINKVTTHNITAVITTGIILSLISTREQFFIWNSSLIEIASSLGKVFRIITWVCCRSCLWYFRSTHGSYRLFTSFKMPTLFSLTYSCIRFSTWGLISLQKNFSWGDVMHLLWKSHWRWVLPNHIIWR